MVFCSQCGSSSRDMQGICRGCGATLSSAEPIVTGPHATESRSEISAAQRKPFVPPIFAVDRLSRKNPWVAVLLALFSGPIGMIYSTPVGALVMAVVSLPAMSLWGGVAAWAVWPVCMLWAGLAARE